MRRAASTLAPSAPSKKPITARVSPWGERKIIGFLLALGLAACATTCFGESIANRVASPEYGKGILASHFVIATVTMANFWTSEATPSLVIM